MRTCRLTDVTCYAKGATTLGGLILYPASAAPFRATPKSIIISLVKSAETLVFPSQRGSNSVKWTAATGHGNLMLTVAATTYLKPFCLCFMRSVVLNPNQFQVDEAWIAFTLNDAPIRTEQDGVFNCVCLMDAASCFILGMAFVSAQEAEPSEIEVRRLFKTSLEHNKKLPNRLFIPAGQFQTALVAEAQRQGVVVVPVRDGELSLFTREAREGFRDHVQRGGDEA